MSALRESESLWVFAYASLLWKPGFEYRRAVVGHIKGFKRRFFQGNTNARGCSNCPGRVAILVPDADASTWGVAYEIRGRRHVAHAVEHLIDRELRMGGLHTFYAPFYTRQDAALHAAKAPHPAPHHARVRTTSGCSDGADSNNSESEGEEEESDDSDDDRDELDSLPVFPVLAFTATKESACYLGEAALDDMARQVVAARGQCGPNTEYVLRTADYIRQHIPEDTDPHTHDLAQAVRRVLAAQNTKPQEASLPTKASQQHDRDNQAPKSTLPSTLTLRTAQNNKLQETFLAIQAYQKPDKQTTPKSSLPSTLSSTLASIDPSTKLPTKPSVPESTLLLPHTLPHLSKQKIILPTQTLISPP